MDYIVLVGQRSAGKDTVADYLQSEYGLEQVVFSEEIMDLGLELGEITQDMLDNDLKGTLADWGTRIRQMENGSEMYITRVIEKAKQGYQIINGMRDNIELEKILEELDAEIWYVKANPITRFIRTYKAGLTTGPLHFLKLTKKPTEQFIESLGKKADVVITNNGSLDSLYRKVDRKIDN